MIGHMQLVFEVVPADGASSFEVALTLVVVIASTLISLVTFLTGLRSRGSKREAQLRMPLESKLDEVLSLSNRLMTLNREVQAEFDLQLVATKKAQQDARDAAAIASQNEEQRKAMEKLVSAQLDAVLARTTRADRRFQIIVATVSFLLGVGVTIAGIFITQVLFA